MKTTPFQIYNASAGSGKTFTLVREYLCILLGSTNKDLFKQVLAITFTNKAVNEMKERVLESLAGFARPAQLEKPSPLFLAVRDQLGLPPEVIQGRAKSLLHYILHNYAFFDIVTIDKFTHRLIRTFARDLELPQNFEVVMDTESLLKEAIDDLLYQAGEEEILTKTLIQFALEKADDDKNWDLSRDLYQISKLLLNENDRPYLEGLKGKSLKDFQGILSQIREESGTLRKQLQALATEALARISEAGIAHNHFSRSSLPKFLEHIREGNTGLKLDAKWLDTVDSEPLYPKNTKGDKAAIDALQPMLAETVNTIKAGLIRFKFLQALYRNLAPMSLINAVNKEMARIKEEQQLLPISEFNNLIAEAIREQPAPFIYERLGERYRDYFIDEFQDTSALQWNNLIPLISNALSGESLGGRRGSLLLVGDAKQSIYRWRGGKAEQFIDLYGKPDHNPFHTPKEVINLPVNYRSHDAIVNFNNDFFSFISRFLSDPSYSDLFARHSTQETNGKAGGFIRFEFIDKDLEDTDLAQLESTLETIHGLKAQGYEWGDIAVLNRGNKEALKIAQHLTQAGIPVISSESLLLKNDPKVNFLVNLVKYTYREEDRENLLELLWFLGEKAEVQDLHLFLSEALDNPGEVFAGYGFSKDLFRELPFYNALEYSLKCFELCDGDEAYLQAFLDTVLDFTQKESGSLGDFVTWWDNKKKKLSLSAPDHANAIQILTIHKSKGLEFPVVIYPFADSDIYKEVDPKLWIALEENPWDLTSALFNKNAELEDFGEEAAMTLENYTAKQELDTFNVLYVAFTRAVERLYVICKEKTRTNGEENLKFLSGIFMNYLKEKGLWQDGVRTYDLGEAGKQLVSGKQPNAQIRGIPFISNEGLLDNYTIVTTSGSLWGTDAEASIERGHLYHDLLSMIRYPEDLEEVLEEALLKGDLTGHNLSQTREYLEKVITHPDLKEFFSRDYEIYRERELLTAQGQLLRPDRFMIAGGKAWIIDYKTGGSNPKYERQLEQYARALQDMGLEVIQKLLVYIDEEIRVEKLT
ncbi:UvrD-helicase domain-containing protein [Robertkochia flava]|uniref:UvrD-helicase domain-containing protein n=1 Tax=Robertkochia flava TaxID=3447986 RepID=UPI001CCBB83C|nr:UvrD-helicase domain-containing protein [Robertkochia marina]